MSDLGYDWPTEVSLGMVVRIAYPGAPQELVDRVGTVVGIDEDGLLTVRMHDDPRVLAREVHIEEVEAL